MADDNAQDTGQVAQPQPDLPEVTVSAKRQYPQPTNEDLAWLNEKPERWQTFEQEFGSLPKGWSATDPAKLTPTQADIDWLQADPARRVDKFRSTFGDLPSGFKDPAAKESGWRAVASGVGASERAGVERMEAAPQEAGGVGSMLSGAVTGILNKVTGANARDNSSPYAQAQLRLEQSIALPDAVEWARKNNKNLIDDPLVQMYAERNGVRPDQFVSDWQKYYGKSPEELRSFQEQQRGAMQDAQAEMAKGRQRREAAGAMEQRYAPAVTPGSLKSAAVSAGQIAGDPVMIGSIALGMVPFGQVPAVAMMSSDIAARSYSHAKDMGLTDANAKAYGVLSGATALVPGVTVSQMLSKAPGMGMVLQSAIGKTLGASAATKLAGNTLDQTLSLSVMNLLQQGVDKGYIDPNMSLKDALGNVLKDLGGTVALAGGLSGIHAGVHRVVHGPQTPQEIQDRAAHDDLLKQDADAKQAEAEAKAGAATDKGNAEAEPTSPSVDANVSALQRFTAGEKVTPTEIDTLVKNGLMQIGQKSGRPMVSPAGRRAMADAAAKPKDDANAPTPTQARGTDVGLGGEDVDTEAQGRAPRTPDEAEDAIGAEQRRTQAFDQKDAVEAQGRAADTERAYSDKGQREQRARDEDFGPAKNQVAEQTIEQAPYAKGGDPGAYLTIKEAMEIARNRPVEIAAQIPRMEGLDPGQREIESRFVDKIANNLPGAIDQYNRLPDTMGGKIISTDEARHLSDDYDQNANLSQEVHEPASWFANMMFKRALSEPPRPGEDNLVLFTAGGTGSGKSSTLLGAGPLVRKAQTIFDTVLNGKDTAEDKIQASLDAGKWVSIGYVYRGVKEAFQNGTLFRANLNGRIVPAQVHLDTHAGAPKALWHLMDKYRTDPRVAFVGIDNTGGDGNAKIADIETLLKRNADEHATFGELKAIGKEMLSNGEITPEIYERTFGERVPASAHAEDVSDGRGDGGKAEPEHRGPEERGRAEGERKRPTVGEVAKLTDAEREKLARVETRTRRRLAEERMKDVNLRAHQQDVGPYSRLGDAIHKTMDEWINPENPQSRSAHEMLDSILSGMKKAGGKGIDPRLAMLAVSLRNYMPNLRVHFRDQIINPKTGKPFPADAQGLFSGFDHSIQVRTSGSRAQMLRAFLHESVHAATSYEIAINPKGTTATKMKALFEEARQLAMERYGEDLIKAHDDYFNDNGERPSTFVNDFYGLTNLHEFVAEAFSSMRFQSLLDELAPATRRNTAEPTTGFFKRFVEVVREFLSRDTAGGGVNTSLLEDVIAAGGEMMEHQRKNMLASGMFKIGEKLQMREDADEKGGDVARDIADNRMSRLVVAASDLGAMKMARGIVRAEDWKDAMRQELGKGVEPALDQLYQLSKDRVAEVRKQVYKERPDGSIVGGPGKGFTASDIKPLRAQLKRLAREGEFGKDWYDKSSRALIDAVGGDKTKARQLAGLFSIYSAGASMDANTTMALRAWYQFEHGEAINTGTSDKDELAHKWLEDGVEPTGMKRSNFYGNLIKALDGDEQTRMYTGGVTVDRWMMRALGYTREAPTDAQYAFVADQIRQVGKSLKWTPEQMQAAVWVSIKARWETVADDVRAEALKKGWIKQTHSVTKGKQIKVLDPERYYGTMLDRALAVTLPKGKIEQAARDFSDSLKRHRAQVSWEATPGVGSGRLPGAENLPVASLEAFQHDISAAHINPATGNDHLQEALGLLHGGRIEGNSAWFRDPGQVMRFRHWGPEGLTSLDPAKQGTGTAGQISERNRTTKVTSLYPYELGAQQPEPQVAAGRKQYIVEVPAEQLYDASRDVRGFKDAAMEPTAFDMDGNALEHALDYDGFEKMIRDAGFKGYYVSDRSDPLMGGQARLFEPWPAHDADTYAGKNEPDLYARAGVQEVLYAPPEKGAAKTGTANMDPDARKAFESYAAAIGKLNHQDAVGWHRPRFDTTLKNANGIDVKLADASRDDFMRAYKAVYDGLWAEGLSDSRRAEFAPIQTPEGFRFINWGAMDNRRFQSVVKDAMTSTFGDRHTATPFAADGGLINAADYDRTIADNGHAERLSGPMADIGKRIETAYREFAQRHGLSDASVTSAGKDGGASDASAPIPLDQLTGKVGGLGRNIMSRFGKAGAHDPEAMRLYPIEPQQHLQPALDLAKKLGFGLEYFSFVSDPSRGIEFRLPQLGKKGYGDGTLWIYDPRVDHGSFHDADYTRVWRVAHELGHALTEPFMQSRYGDSHRYGALGRETMQTRGALGKQKDVPVRGLTLAEAQRAIEWEDTAFRAQRILMEKLGINISDADFAREYNLNMADAMVRTLTGDFSNPAVVPSSQKVDVKDVLKALEGTEQLLAKAQGREPTSGYDLNNWQPVSDDDIRRAIEAKENGSKVKFSVRPQDHDFQIRAVDSTGADIAGEHTGHLFDSRADAEDYVQNLAENRAKEIGGKATHEEGWSSTQTPGRKNDRTYSIEPVSRDLMRGQKAQGTGTPADNFMREWSGKHPEVEGGLRLVNGNVMMGVVNDVVDTAGRTMYVTNVHAYTPGRGDGTRAIRDLISMADKHGVALELNPVAFAQDQPKNLRQQELESWYKKAGFKPVDTGEQNGLLMRREPNAVKDVPVFQTNAGKGLSDADAAKVLEHAKRMFPNAQHHVVDSIEDAPHEVQAQAELQGVTDRVAAAITHDYDGTHVYLVRNNAESVESALHTILQEHVGHNGIANTFGAGVSKLMDGFLRNDFLRHDIGVVAKRWGLDVKNPDPVVSREAWRAATEEWLAHTVARGVLYTKGDVGRAQGPLTKVISAAKLWLNQMGLPITLTDADARHAIVKAHGYVKSGKWLNRVPEYKEAQVRDKVQFAVKPTGNADLDELLNDKIGAPKIGWRTRLSAAVHDIRSRAVTSGLDRMRRLKDYEDDLKVPPAESGYISSRLTTNVAPLLRNLIEFGGLKWTSTIGFDPDKSMMPDYHDGVQPLNQILAPLHNDPDMLRHFEGYLVALRSRELAAQGRENLLEQRHIQAGLDLAKQYPHFVQMQRDLAAINRNVLDFAEKAGVIDPESRKMWESDYYVPFYRVTDDASAGPWSAGSLAKVRNPIMRLMGGKENLNDVTGNIVRNWSTLINAAIKAHAVRVAVDNLSAAGVAVRVPALERAGDALVSTSEVNKLLQQHGITQSLSPSAVGGIQKLMSLSTPQGDDVVQVWRGGKREYYRLADPGLAVAFSSMRGSPLRNLRDDPIGKWIVGAGTMPKMVLTKLTTENPAFGLRTLWKDNINAWTVGRGLMPVTPVVSAVTGLVKTMKANGAFKRMAAAGATFNAGRADPYDTNVTAQRYITAPSLMGRLWDGYRNMMLSGENASRVTIYERTLAETGSHKLAAYEARDLMDYAMRGSSPVVQFLVETVPFWGAHVQGLYKTVRAMNPDASLTYSQLAGQVAKRVAPLFIKGSLLSLAAAALYSSNRQRQDYNDLPDIQKELYYHIYLGDTHIKIPKAFESGTIFGTVPEAITEVLMSKFDPQTTKEQTEYLMHAFGAALNLYPRVTAVTPLYELATNHDTATQYPILSEHDIGLMPGEQVGTQTSPLVTDIARAMPGAAPQWLQSPKQFQHLLQGYFGIMGSYALNAADFMYRKAANLPAAPERNLGQIPVVGSFVTRTDEPATSTKALGELSTVMIAANQLHQSISDLQKKGDDESIARAEKLQREHLDLMIASQAMKPASDQIRTLQTMKRQVQNSDMSPAEKQDYLNQIQSKINDAARDVYEYRPGGKMNREVLDAITSDKTPAAKAKTLRDNDMPALASIALQYGTQKMPPAVQAAIEELG